MKKILIGLLALASVSTYALDECKIDVVYDVIVQEIQVQLIQNSGPINFLGQTRSCQEFYLDLTEKGNLSAEISSETIRPINYIYSQSLLGSLNELELNALKEFALLRNARITQNEKLDISFMKH